MRNIILLNRSVYIFRKPGQGSIILLKPSCVLNLPRYKTFECPYLAIILAPFNLFSIRKKIKHPLPVRAPIPVIRSPTGSYWGWRMSQWSCVIPFPEHPSFPFPFPQVGNCLKPHLPRSLKRPQPSLVLRFPLLLISHSPNRLHSHTGSQLFPLLLCRFHLSPFPVRAVPKVPDTRGQTRAEL